MCFSCTSMKQFTIISCSSLIEWMSVYVYTMLGVLVRVMITAYEHINHEHIYVMWCTLFFQFSYLCCTTSFPFLNLFFFPLPILSFSTSFLFSLSLFLQSRIDDSSSRHWFFGWNNIETARNDQIAPTSVTCCAVHNCTIR